MNVASFGVAADAIRSPDPDRLEALLAAEPALVDARGDFDKTLLHEAAEVDALEAVRVLIAAGADVEARTSWGHSPLEWAATMGAVRVGRFLVEAGARGLNLWTAAGLGDLNTVRAAVDNGQAAEGSARPPSPDARRDQRPAGAAYRRGDVISDGFYTAARNGHIEVAAFLFRVGADIDAEGFFGASGLHWAAHNGHEHMVEWLVEHGAALENRDSKFDATPAEWAHEGGHPSIAEYLIRSTQARGVSK